MVYHTSVPPPSLSLLLQASTDPSSSSRDLRPRRHFHSEVLIPALKALSLASASRSERPELARNLWIPRAWDEMGDKGWKDPSGESASLFSFPPPVSLFLPSWIPCPLERESNGEN